MITAADVLRHYVRRHNDGVRAGDFSALLEMFDDAARAALARDLAKHPPKDAIVILSSHELDSRTIEAEYAWGARPAERAGTLRIEIDGGSIARLSVR